MRGSHCIKSWSKTQPLVALLSAKSRLCALVQASAEAMGSQSVIRDLGQSWSTVVYSDASSALGVMQRQGLERLRHVGCIFLFVQGLNEWKVVQDSKVLGSHNPADVCTRGFNADVSVSPSMCALDQHMTSIAVPFSYTCTAVVSAKACAVGTQ